ncbi:MAG: TRAP transporter fused permease subunit [Gammaproteobacteria bacterium]|nr:TRAP transporter fused permease subunit [Gammaproteobacteria bacterium]
MNDAHPTAAAPTPAPTQAPTQTPTQEQLDAIERKYDEASQTRQVGARTGVVLRAVALLFSIYHFITAGFGLPTSHWHLGIHLSGLFVLIYAFFPVLKSKNLFIIKATRYRIGNIPIYDWVFMLLGVAASLYVGFAWHGVPLLGIEEQTFRMGNPNAYDITLGCILIVLVLDIVRRTLGWILPLIICLFIGYALLGPYAPDLLRHPGVRFNTFVSSMYFPQEGIFGVTLWVVSTIVFHFVLFGVVAQRTGLGKLFIDNATILAGRYAGGPAKVSVISSAFFGTISGSSVANTVSTGALTIPNMKRLGYPGHFAGGVEAAASAGGQITPPIMGAAAFVMAEFLEVPYTTIVIAAIFPAFLHYVGVLSVVHLMARRINLTGMSKDMLPRINAVWRRGWAHIVPLVALLYVLFSGYTPFMAAFCGISLLLVVSMCRIKQPLTLGAAAAFLAFVVWKYANGSFDWRLTALLAAAIFISTLNPQPRIKLGEIIDCMEVGVKYALAVGAACAAVGIVIGVINTTGIGFRIGFMVTQAAGNLAESLHALLSVSVFAVFELASVADLQLFLSLLFIAVACILMGAGIPTTALYIMLVSVAQPALAQLGIPPIASHLFVLFYGVVSEITPPICTSAYAAAAIANANPFRTGISAFTLGLGKIVAPMAFVYAPVLLIVSSAGFDLATFSYAAASCIAGVIALSVAVVGFWFAPLGVIARLLAGIAGLVFIAPSPYADLAALIIIAPVLISQLPAMRKRRGRFGGANG